MRKQIRYYIKTQCSACGQEKLRRKDMRWSGLCAKCSSKEVSERPEVKAIRRASGLKNPPPRENVKNYRRGPANNKWRGGITPATQKIRTSAAMKEWRLRVFERDDYTCAVCSQRGGDLHADHIKPFALFPELHFDPDNGRTLCIPCHRAYGALVCNGVLTRPSLSGPSDGTDWRIG